MKRYLFLTQIFLVILTLCPRIAKADHCAGGEISYEWVSDSTYRIYLKFYRDCSGINTPNTFSLCYRNTCNSQGGTLILNKITTLPDGKANGSEVAPSCPGFPTRCSSSTSSIPGFHEWWYTNTITLPSRCNYWRFSISTSARSLGISNIPGGSFYIEATLNNLDAQGNSSPFFSVKPVPYVCINKPYTYNNGGIDPNSDSLFFETIQPLGGGACPAAPTSINFSTGNPSYNLVTNPFQTNNTYSIDSNTGQMKFTPGLTGKHTVAIRIKEYRNGILIGTVIRDIQIQVLNCSTKQVSVGILPATVFGANLVNGRVEGCAGAALSFCYDIKSPDTSAVLVATDNHNFAAPGSLITYSVQPNDSIRGCFSWIPNPLDTGLRVLTVTVKDSTCTSPGIMIAQTFVLPVYIYPITYIWKDTGICYGDSIQLLAVGGSTFTWSVISGSSISSLSCTACKTPYAKPSVTTQYSVTSNLSSYCPKNKDTITIMVSTRPATPSASSNSPVCSGDSLKLFGSSSTSYTYYWTGPNGYVNFMQNPSIYPSKLSDSGYYILRMLVNGCASYPDSEKVTMLNGTKPPPPTFTHTINYCHYGNTIALSASGNNIKWYTMATGGTVTSTPPIPSSATPGVFKWWVTQQVGCAESDRDSVTVNVFPIPAPPVTANLMYCQGDTTSQLTAVGFNLLWYQAPTGGTGTPTAPKPSSAITGIYVFYVSQRINSCESGRSLLTVTINEAPVANIASSKAAVCQNDTLLLWNAAVNKPGVSHVWTFDTATIKWTNSIDSSIAYWSKTGYKKVKLTVANTNCIIVDSVVVSVGIPINAVASNDTTICYADSATLIAFIYSGQPSFTYSWSPATALGCSSCMTTKAAPLADVTYKITVKNTFNCVDSDFVTVHVNNSVNADINLPKDTICRLEEITLKNIGSFPVGTVHTWSVDTASVLGGAATPTIILNWSRPGLKKVVLHLALGLCTAADSVNIFIQPDPIASFELNYNACIGNPLNMYPKQQDAFYHWTIDGIKITDTVFKSPIELRWFTLGKKKISLLLTDRFGCNSPKYDTAITVREHPVATIEPVDQRKFCTADTVTLHAETNKNYNYAWSPQTYFIENNEPDVTARAPKNSFLVLQVTNEWGCADYDTVYLNSEACCKVFFPDAFTPNGDGRNDKFRMLSPGEHTIHTFIIVDRWGKIVYQSQDATDGWDGTYKGQPQDPDTYFYYVKYICEGNNVLEEKGNFILVR